MTKSQRTVRVRDGDVARGGYVWGYGVRLIARLAQVDEQNVREAMSQARGKEPPVDPSNMVEVIAWALTVRGHKRLANRVRKVLSETS